jgi:hypothetical protein
VPYTTHNTSSPLIVFQHIRNHHPSTHPPSPNHQDPTKYTQMLAMVDCTGGALAPFPGGVLLRAVEGGEVLGAVGVSGASADEDELCALMGVREAGLEGVVTDPAESAIQ